MSKLGTMDQARAILDDVLADQYYGEADGVSITDQLLLAIGYVLVALAERKEEPSNGKDKAHEKTKTEKHSGQRQFGASDWW